jgi:hypothetical protein
MEILSNEPATPTHRYLAGTIDRAAWFEVEACPVVELSAEPDAVVALAQALGAAAADLWLDGRFEVG